MKLCVHDSMWWEVFAELCYMKNIMFTIYNDKAIHPLVINIGP